MKKFIKLTVLFSLPIFFMLIAIEFLLRYIPNDYAYKCNFVTKNSSTIEVLYLGSSHTFYGVNPVYSKFNSFNASHISQSLNFDFAILEKYKNNWAHLKYIVVPVDYFSLYYSLENSIESWRIKNYSIYYRINQGDSYKYNFEILNGKFKNNLARLKSVYIDDSSDMSCNRLGWGANYHSSNSRDLTETGRIAAIRHTIGLKDSLCFKKNVETIKSMIEFAGQHHVEIIFLTCPAFKTYVENLENKQLANTINTVTQLSSGYANSSYYNLLEDQSFGDKDFYDADHLNEIGAKKLTLLIDSIIDSKKSMNAQQGLLLQNHDPVRRLITFLSTGSSKLL